MRTCVICGKDTSSPYAKICLKCANNIINKAENPDPGICPVCGKAVPKHWRKYCSKTCRNKVYELQNRVKIRHLPTDIDIRHKHASKIKRNDKNDRLDMHIKNARKLWLSYGMYMAKLRGGEL